MYATNKKPAIAKISACSGKPAVFRGVAYSIWDDEIYKYVLVAEFSTLEEAEKYAATITTPIYQG